MLLAFFQTHPTTIGWYLAGSPTRMPAADGARVALLAGAAALHCARPEDPRAVEHLAVVAVVRLDAAGALAVDAL